MRGNRTKAPPRQARRSRGRSRSRHGRRRQRVFGGRFVNARHRRPRNTYSQEVGSAGSRRHDAGTVVQALATRRVHAAHPGKFSGNLAVWQPRRFWHQPSQPKHCSIRLHCMRQRALGISHRHTWWRQILNDARAELGSLYASDVAEKNLGRVKTPREK